MVAKDPKKIKHIRCTEFENDVVKLRNNEEAKLTPRGKEALNIFYFQQMTGMFRDLRGSFHPLIS